MKKAIIAECCQNHNGNLEILKDMVWAAAEAGADYVKIQDINSNELTKRERFEQGIVEAGIKKAIKRPYQPEYERLKKLDLDEKVYSWFIDECKRAGVYPLTTVFTRGNVEQFAKFGWKFIKIASYDCASIPLLRDVKGRFDHIFVSTGATFDYEIEEAAKTLSDTSFSFLHCVTIYPTPLSELHLSRMEFLRCFTPSVGFSDHSLTERDGIKASVVALYLGADVIERHFTILKPWETKDGPVSITPDQLKALSVLAHAKPEIQKDWIDENVGDFSMMIGQKHRELSREELLNRDYYRGRFATHVPGGEVIYNWEDRDLI
jgi:sialic acid synthase SpsE